jgi:hypothetical protein
MVNYPSVVKVVPAQLRLELGSSSSTHGVKIGAVSFRGGSRRMARQLTFKNESYSRAIRRIQRRRGSAIAVFVIGQFLVVVAVIVAVFQLF